MWSRLLTGAGLKWVSLAVVALVVGWIFYTTIQSTQEAERDKVTIEILSNQNEVRQQVNEAVEDQRSQTVEEAINYLENRDD